MQVMVQGLIIYGFLLSHFTGHHEKHNLSCGYNLMSFVLPVSYCCAIDVNDPRGHTKVFFLTQTVIFV